MTQQTPEEEQKKKPKVIGQLELSHFGTDISLTHQLFMFWMNNHFQYIGRSTVIWIKRVVSDVVLLIRRGRHWRADWTEDEFGCSVAQVVRLCSVNGTRSAFYGLSQWVASCASTGMWGNCQLYCGLLQKEFLAGLRIQIGCWIKGWDGGRLERRRDRILPIETTLWLDNFHQVERRGREEPPVRHRQLGRGE